MLFVQKREYFSNFRRGINTGIQGYSGPPIFLWDLGSGFFLGLQNYLYSIISYGDIFQEWVDGMAVFHANDTRITGGLVLLVQVSGKLDQGVQFYYL